MITVGLTGGIASGKSLVATMFKHLGAYVIDSDQIAREVVKPGCEGWQKVVTAFGHEILTRSGEIDREKLGAIVFSNNECRTTLNELLHPLIINIIKQRIAGIGKRDQSAIIVVDIPLLIECNLQKDFDKVILVWVSSEIQRKRLMERSGFSEEEAKLRINTQMPLIEKRNLATYIIDNDKNITDTEQQVSKLFYKLKQESRKN